MRSAGLRSSAQCRASSRVSAFRVPERERPKQASFEKRLRQGQSLLQCGGSRAAIPGSSPHSFVRRAGVLLHAPPPTADHHDHDSRRQTGRRAACSGSQHPPGTVPARTLLLTSPPPSSYQSHPPDHPMMPVWYSTSPSVQACVERAARNALRALRCRTLPHRLQHSKPRPV